MNICVEHVFLCVCRMRMFVSVVCNCVCVNVNMCVCRKWKCVESEWIESEVCVESGSVWELNVCKMGKCRK